MYRAGGEGWGRNGKSFKSACGQSRNSPGRLEGSGGGRSGLGTGT